MLEKLALWAIKKLVFFWDRHGDKLAFSFSGGERLEYSIIVERYYDDHYTVGTAMYQYNKAEEDSPIITKASPASRGIHERRDPDA